jgi:hypothetical protein
MPDFVASKLRGRIPPGTIAAAAALSGASGRCCGGGDGRARSGNGLRAGRSGPDGSGSDWCHATWDTAGVACNRDRTGGEGTVQDTVQTWFYLRFPSGCRELVLSCSSWNVLVIGRTQLPAGCCAVCVKHFVVFSSDTDNHRSNTSINGKAPVGRLLIGRPGRRRIV